VLNRAVTQLTLFKNDGDYETFLTVVDEALARHPIRILSYCIMPNHWHFVLWPKGDQDVTNFLRWLTHTHTMRWHAQHQTTGTGHLYQGRFKAFPIQQNSHLYSVLRYVERNPLRAGLVKRGEKWRWSSLSHRGEGKVSKERLSAWPVAVPRDWTARVNKPQTPEEEEALRRAVNRGTPFGSDAWKAATAKELELEFTMRARGRPKKLVN